VKGAPILLEKLPPFDDIENLYVGRIIEAKGIIVTEVGPLNAQLFGEILFYGHTEGEMFVVERLRRLALYGALLEPTDDARVGILSLSGPLGEPPLKPGSTGTVEEVQLQLHYTALSEQLKPLLENEDAEYPPLEQITASLTWAQAGIPDQVSVPLEIRVDTKDIIDKKLGFVLAITLEPVVLVFQLIGSGQAPPAPHFSLPGNCPAPGLPCGPTMQTPVRILPVKFINFSKTAPATVEALCKDQIDGVCEVWRNKAALDLNVDLTATPTTVTVGIIEGTADQKNAFAEPDATQENSLPLLLPAQTLGGSPSPSLASVGHVEIYVVDKLLDRPGGGITKKSGQADAFCIIGLNKASTNKYLLAHELGHVLGLAHPEENMLCYPGSWESVTQASGPINANPNANTLYNCRIFLQPKAGCPLTLTPIMQTSAALDCFRPDPVDHFIRDFPADSGNEPSLPPPGFNRVSNSNVWNRHNLNDPGGINVAGGPEHQEPLCMVQNHLYVKLEYRTSLRDPVDVNFYLAVPGIGTSGLNLVLLNSQPLAFDPPPLPGAPIVKSIAWSVQSSFPSHCCVYAIGSSADERAPSPLTFGTIAPLLGADNDIAQRNLNIQGCTPMLLSSLPVWLPWLMLANPLVQAAPASLIIDATAARQLLGLSLEIDDKRAYNVSRDEPMIVNITDQLEPDQFAILRLRALLPPGLSEGTVLPIDLKLQIGDIVCSYQHLLRVAPLAETTIQVLDALFAALRDVHVACTSADALLLAQSVARIARKQATDPRQLFASLRRLSGRIATLAQSIDSDSMPECRIVQRRLYELAGLLLTWTNTSSPELFAERVRDLADRIQEPAGRLGRALA
jgi:hypothetical protein